MSKQLKEMIKAFHEKADFFAAKFQQCDDIHKRFLKRWPREQLNDLLTLESYVIGTGKHDTFCYWVERETRILGSILGAPASKFKVYFSSEAGTYRFVKPFQSAEEAFETTKAQILALLDAAAQDDAVTVKANKLFKHSHLFRGKLLHLYFPDKFICIFSEQDIDYFLDRLGVEFDPKEHVLNKKQKLLRYKEDSDIFKSWESRTFMHFLYDQFQPPSHSHGSGDSKPSQTDSELRREEGHFALPSVDGIEVEVVEIGEVATPASSKKKGKGKTNYIAEAIRNTKLGNHGEDLIVQHEKKALRVAKKKALADRVERVSTKDDSLGYDIVSFFPNGEEKYIEVKSTTGSVAANTPFYLTENERKKMEEMGDRYYVYRLMAANTRKPKLLILNASTFSDRCKMETKLWQVSLLPCPPTQPS